jgi:hypothetical protein
VLESHNNTEPEVQAPNGHKSDDQEDDVEEESKKKEVNGPLTSSDVQVEGVVARSTESAQLKRQDILIQSLFDVYLLQQSLLLHAGADTPTPSIDDGLSRLEEYLKAQVADLTDASVPRLKRAAQEYWKRTGLLFGLLG